MTTINYKYSEREGEVAHIDHIFPFYLRLEYDGHINDIENLQALCPNCNFRKNRSSS
jgi:5-methylcytosine-specific restriction endonuclease McrA